LPCIFFLNLGFKASNLAFVSALRTLVLAMTRITNTDAYSITNGLNGYGQQRLNLSSVTDPEESEKNLRDP